jgi:protein arginine N-methyltransferase 1
MGYFLLYESMFDSVVFARDKWLAKGGKLFPNKASMFIAAIEDEDYFDSISNFWKDNYGFSMKSLKSIAMRVPAI